jgi:oligopeptide/dipeptide ABC transporter ATP-binding protein
MNARAEPEVSGVRAAPSRALLRVEDLVVQFRTRAGVVRAVEGVQLQVDRGQTLAIVGESGSGKSVTAMSLLRLVESQGGTLERGQIWFEGRDLARLTQAQMRAVRGNEIAMIFQEPMTSLNPVYSVGNQIAEAVTLHRGLDAAQAWAEAVRLLDLVGVADPKERANAYPHQLSGGMRQRVMIAMALSCNPKLLIADEPTTALDVTIQAQILELLADLQSRLGMALLLITHDLGVVAQMAHRVAVMYAGRVVEEANVVDLFERPKHPYTVGLLRSLPNPEKNEPLRPIAGSVPDALSLPTGCRFHPRCVFCMPICRQEQPALKAVVRTGLPLAVSAEERPHFAACHYSEREPDSDLSKQYVQLAETQQQEAT